MPAELTGGIGAEAIDLADCIAALDAAPPDLQDDKDRERAAALLRGLYANRDFLVRRAITSLHAYCRDTPEANRYGAQVFMLHRLPGRHFIRANFWPPAQDPLVRASGAAHFYYDIPHDHNFDFLTIGYCGPGYRSRWYTHDASQLAGYPREPAALVLTEDGILGAGRLLHYRAHVDVHAQLPPAALSVSLNIVTEDAALGWRDQYLFDLDARCIETSPTITPAEILLRMALLHGGEGGAEVADAIARHHPSDRGRWNGWRALIGAASSRAERHAIAGRAAADHSKLVQWHARAMLALLDDEGGAERDD